MARASLLSGIPVAILVLLLLLATWFDGAFALHHWAPVAILGLVMVAAAIAGGLRVEGRAEHVALAALWGFAAWALLSALWAESPGQALEGGGRTLLYAALFTVALATPLGGRVSGRLGRLVVAGIALVGAVTLVQLAGDGAAEFLAGRLDAPVGYRNATACLFAMAFWPLVAAAAHRTALAPLRGLACSGAVLVLGLATLTGARGALLGLVAGGAVALALGPDRLRRASVALIVCGWLAVFVDDLLTPYRAFTDGRLEDAADIAVAVDALVFAVALAAVLGLVGALLDGGTRLSNDARLALRRAGTAALLLLVAASGLATVAIIGNPVGWVGDRYDEFRSLDTAAPGETRLTFGGGQRSDIWRVALVEFSERPIGGVGEGNFEFRYYEERRTDRNLSTPHSLAFGLLAEKGLVGTFAFLVFLAGVATAALRRWRDSVAETRWVASGLLAAAAVAFGQSLVDWIWHIPGVAGLAFVLLGLGVATLAPDGRRPAGARGRPLLRWGGAAALAVAALGTTLLYLSDADLRRARAAEATPAERLDSARAAARLNPWAVAPLYLQAGAREELGQPRAARHALLDAAVLEPRSFVAYGLLGDLELRLGNRAAARRWYRRALELNPLDAGLRELARRPGAG